MSVIVWENTIIIWKKKQQRELPHAIADCCEKQIDIRDALVCKCEVTMYCSRKCQKAHLPKHKKDAPKDYQFTCTWDCLVSQQSQFMRYSWCKFCHWSWSFSIPTFNEPASDAPPSPWVFIFHVSSVKNMQDKNQSYKSLCNNTQMLLVSNCSRWNRKIHGLGKCKNTCYRFLPSLYEPIKLPPSRP